MTGALTVLNVGAGDITIEFDGKDDGATRRAVQMLEDMMERGYLIAIQLKDGTFTRAVDIDPTRGRYIVVMPEGIEPPADAEPVRQKRGRPRKVSVPIDTTQAYGVARSAGG